jgi:hypothetical protein
MADHEWQELFSDAFRANERDKQLAYIIGAEDAVRARASLDGKISRIERVGLRTALMALEMLKHGGEPDSLAHDALSFLEGDVTCWEHAAQHCEEFAKQLAGSLKQEWLLQCAVYRERAKMSQELVTRMRGPATY